MKAKITYRISNKMNQVLVLAIEIEMFPHYKSSWPSTRRIKTASLRSGYKRTCLSIIGTSLVMK